MLKPWTAVFVPSVSVPARIGLSASVACRVSVQIREKIRAGGVCYAAAVAPEGHRELVEAGLSRGRRRFRQKMLRRAAASAVRGVPPLQTRWPGAVASEGVAEGGDERGEGREGEEGAVCVRPAQKVRAVAVGRRVGADALGRVRLAELIDDPTPREGDL